MKEVIQTSQAPAAIGHYSQAIRFQDTVYLSGQIALNPQTMTMVNHSIDAEIQQVFENLKAVAAAAGQTLDSILKLTVYLTDIANIANVNAIMSNYFTLPYPARTSIQVSALPKSANIEIDAILKIQ